MNDGFYLRHMIIGFVFRGSELYQGSAQIVETKKLKCKVKFLNKKVEITLKEEDEKEFIECSAFQYGNTFFRREGMIRALGKRKVFNGEEIIGIYRELADVSKDIAISKAIIDRIKNNNLTVETTQTNVESGIEEE